MGLKIAVVTPYCKESLDQLFECHQSVIDQDVSAEVTHFLVADGFPMSDIDTWNCSHVKLPCSNNDVGNTPRGIGGLLADSLGFDFVAYLDADNWYKPGHLSSLLALYSKTKCSILTSLRTYHSEDGEQMDVREPDEDSLTHVDTSCYVLHRSAFKLNSVWHSMPHQLGPIGDRIFLAAIKAHRYVFQSSGLRTVGYRTPYAFHYQAAGMPVPELAKTWEVDLRPSVEFLGTPDGIASCVDRLGFWPATFMS